MCLVANILLISENIFYFDFGITPARFQQLYNYQDDHLFKLIGQTLLGKEIHKNNLVN